MSLRSCRAWIRFSENVTSKIELNHEIHESISKRELLIFVFFVPFLGKDISEKSDYVD
jgi:hypothetical protein